MSAQINGKFYVIDSLYHQQHLAFVMPQLKLLYTESAMRSLKYISPQSQVSTNLCGYFSLANTYYVLLDRSVPNGNFCIDQMRNHLRSCLNSGEVTSFPSDNADSVKKTGSSGLLSKTSFQIIPTNEPGKNLIEKYFSDQNKKSVLKKLTKREKYNLKLLKSRNQRQMAKISPKDKRCLKDKERKHKERQNMTSLQKQEIRNKSQERKKMKRKQMSESERNKMTEKDKERKINERSKLTDSEKQKKS